MIGHIGVHPLVSIEWWVTRVGWFVVILSVSVVEFGVTRIGWLSGGVSNLLVISGIRPGDVVFSVVPGLLIVIVWAVCGWRSVVLLELPILWEV